VDETDEGRIAMNPVPKTIYQTWFTKTLPTEIQKTVDAMLLRNPNYRYELSDDADMLSFIEKNYSPLVVDCFKSLTIGAAKADFWRYLMLYKNGGVYLDVDSLITGKLDDLLLDDGCAVISRENNFGMFVQWCLVFPPNHPILGICINNCIENIRGGEIKNVLELTGPIVYSKSIVQFFNDNIIYSRTDDELNAIRDKSGVRFHSFDYNGFAEFAHPNKDKLYTNKPHWSVEQKQVAVIQ